MRYIEKAAFVGAGITELSLDEIAFVASGKQATSTTKAKGSMTQGELGQIDDRGQHGSGGGSRGGVTGGEFVGSVAGILYTAACSRLTGRPTKCAIQGEVARTVVTKVVNDPYPIPGPAISRF